MKIKKDFLLIGALAILRLLLLLRFPLGISAHQAILWGKWGFDETMLVVIGWMTLLTGVFFIRRITLTKAKFWVSLVAITNPWWNVLSLFNVLEMMAITSILALVSFKRPILKLISLGILILVLVLNREVWKGLSQYSIFTQLKPKALSEEINLIQSTNFAATGKSFMLPAIIRKVVYNKPFLAVNIVSQKIISLIDFEQFTAPLSAWEITKISGIPPKGILPLFFFWEVPLLIWGLFRFGKGWWKDYKIWIILGLIPALLWEKKVFTVSGMIWSIPIIGLLGIALSEMKYKFNYGFLVLYLIGYFYFSSMIFTKQSSYRMSDAYLYKTMSSWVSTHINEYDQFVVTNKFGPTDLMFKFYKVPKLEKIKFREFEIKDEHLVGKIVYLGLPKEMAEGKVVDKIETSEELVFGYGNGIWIGTK